MNIDFDSPVLIISDKEFDGTSLVTNMDPEETEHMLVMLQIAKNIILEARDKVNYHPCLKNRIKDLL